MDIRNTLTTKQDSALTQALFTLQTLSDADSILILDFLQEHGEASLLDLTIATGLHIDTIETQLDLLCQTKTVQPRSTIYENYYHLNRGRLARVAAIAGKLVKGRK